MLRGIHRFFPISLSLALAACAQPPASGHAAASSSIVLSEDEQTLWLTSPDDDAVVELDAETLEVRRRVELPGAPAQLARVDGALVVTFSDTADVAWIALGDATSHRVPVPCGGTDAVVPDGRGGALVSCPNDDLVVGVTRDGVEWRMASAGRPTALAVSDDRFAVSASREGRVRVHALDDRALLEEIVLEERPGFAAVQVDALAFSRERASFVGAYQRVDHDSDRDRPPDRGGYGAVVDGSPRIEPMLLGPCGGRYARFDGGARVLSGPSAIASGGGVLWVAHRQTDDVVALRCDGGAALAPRLATFEVGRGPRGLALSEDGRTAWVDVGFGHAVARLALPDGEGPEGPVTAPALERTRVLGDARLSDAAMRGRALFFDAEDTHLTPSGVVTCGTCHPGGGEDGLSWFLHTPGVGPKLRRTPPAWAARAGLAPFHWDGEHDDAAALSHETIRELMQGDGLLVDTAAIAAWMAEAPIPPGRPTRTDQERERVALGRAAFESADCARCHAGALFADGQRHRVLAPSDDADARLEDVDTPSLLAIRARPPYLHDGRAATLRDVLTAHNEGDLHGRTSALTDEELDALVRYLETL